MLRDFEGRIFTSIGSTEPVILERHTHGMGDATDKLICQALVKVSGTTYRKCRKPPEFWRKQMVCFTHMNAKEVIYLK